jgi:hypothetical protein
LAFKQAFAHGRPNDTRERLNLFQRHVFHPVPDPAKREIGSNAQ